MSPSSSKSARGASAARPVPGWLGLAAGLWLAACVGTGPVDAAELAGEILWHAEASDLVQGGPTPARVRYRPVPGERFVLISALLRQSGEPPVQDVVRLRGEEIRLVSETRRYSVLGSFEDTGTLRWFAPELSVFPGGDTRLSCVFSVPQDVSDYRLELGRALVLPLPPTRPRPALRERIELTLYDVAWLDESPPLESSAARAPEARLEPRSGQRLLAVEIELRQRDELATAPFTMSSDDLYLQADGHLYPCLGLMQRERGLVRRGPVAVLLQPGPGPQPTVKRLRALFAVDARESRLWLWLGEVSMAIEPPR